MCQAAGEELGLWLYNLGEDEICFLVWRNHLFGKYSVVLINIIFIDLLMSSPLEVDPSTASERLHCVRSGCNPLARSRALLSE